MTLKFLQVLSQIRAFNVGRTVGRLNIAHKHAEGGRLAGTVHAFQKKVLGEGENWSKIDENQSKMVKVFAIK